MRTTTDIANDPALAEHAAAIYHLAGRVVADAIEIGRRLTDAKRICGHGNFGPWLKREFRWSEDTAERYMRVADLDKFRPVRNLALPLKGLYLLAAPSVPEATRDDIIERAASGESLSVADIKKTIDAAKDRQQPAKMNRTKLPPEIPIAFGTAAARRGLMHPEIYAPEKHDDIGADSTGEIGRLCARNEELENKACRLERENTAIRSEIEEAKAERKSLGEGEGEELGNLLLAWDRASDVARQKFLARVGLVPAERERATASPEMPDIPDFLLRGTS